MYACLTSLELTKMHKPFMAPSTGKQFKVPNNAYQIKATENYETHYQQLQEIVRDVQNSQYHLLDFELQSQKMFLIEYFQ